jgi:hypothetical protein
MQVGHQEPLWFCKLINKQKFAKFVSGRKEAIHTVPYAFYSMLSMFCLQENPELRAQKSAERTRPEIREKLSHYCKEGLALLTQPPPPPLSSGMGGSVNRFKVYCFDRDRIQC